MISVSQKRNCNYCKALYSSDFRHRCTLGYKITVLSEFDNSPVEFKPLEPCPKPLTHKQHREIILDKSVLK